MSQNDLTIANQGFASFRSDLNSALQALGSTNSGSSAPSTTFANQLFYDTTNNILKIRNEDNDAFISLFTLDQTNDNIESLTVDGILTVATSVKTPLIEFTDGDDALTITDGGNVAVGGTLTANGGVTVDNITIDGTEIDLSSGDLDIDVAGNIRLDADDNGEIRLLDGGTQYGALKIDSSRFKIQSIVNDADMMFAGFDGGSEITALTLDMSANGDATFNGQVIIPQYLTHEGDGHTYLQFTPDLIDLYAGGVQGVSVGSSQVIINQGGADFDFRVESTQSTHMLFVDAGNNYVNIGKSSTNSSVAGVSLGTAANFMTRTDGQVLFLNRQNDDGSIVGFGQADSTEGTIAVSGSTVSYNSFSGSHWSRLTDNSKPTILKGTVVETIDEMCDWYQAQFTIVKTDNAPESIKKISISLPSGKSVGDTTSVTYEGITYDDAVIIKEDDNKHTKCKISDTADSTRVYGVFADWDNDDDTVNDMYVTALGTHVVRINKDETVSAGDLLSSNGDGTAKVQDDDIIKSKTIGKVLTNIKQETYSDGSYTVPCALYCG